VVLPRWFVGCCLLLFGSTLQSWGPVLAVGPVDACCLLFFTSTLQGWGPAFPVGSVFFFFAGSMCCTHNLTCVSVIHRFRVSFNALISFSIRSLLFSVCNLQVRIFAYFYSHARHMFLVPSVLWLHFGNRWRYICCLLVRWLLLVHWFVSLLVDCCCCLAQGYEFGPLELQLGLLVISHWFVACCFLFFTSDLQGWGSTPTIGVAFFLGGGGHFAVFRSCTHEWNCDSIFFCV
jgi:hypothetical protein